MGCHPSHWRTPWFFRGIETTNQIGFNMFQYEKFCVIWGTILGNLQVVTPKTIELPQFSQTWAVYHESLEIIGIWSFLNGRRSPSYGTTIPFDFNQESEIHRGSLTSRTIGGLEIIDPTTDAVVFGDANLSFALNLARHRCLALLTKIWEKVVSNLMMIYKDIERYEETWKHMKTRNIYQYIYIIHYNSIYI